MDSIQQDICRSKANYFCRRFLEKVIFCWLHFGVRFGDLTVKTKNSSIFRDLMLSFLLLRAVFLLSLILDIKRWRRCIPTLDRLIFTGLYTSSQHYTYNLNILLLCIGPHYLSFLQQPFIEFTPHFRLMRFVFVFLPYCPNPVRKVRGHFRDHSNVIIVQLGVYVIFN